jgi:hypothetical protein
MAARAGWIIVASVVLVGMGAARGDEKPSASYVHSVVFYLKKDAPKGAVEGLIADAHSLLAKIESVRGLKVGRPAERATPDVAVTDYQVGLLVLFDDYEGLKRYLDHPKHKEYVDRHLKYVEKVLVYDFVNQAK